jgi:uncharacterized 2Fe-2S/4Fe-4S cluster protein (DUF4445 family)
MRGYSLRADCGGQGICGDCRIRYLSPPPDADPDESQHLSERELASGWRLACRHDEPGAVRIEYNPEWENVFRLESFALDTRFAGEHVGFAVDIGTTGLVAALVELSQGVPIRIARGYNPQRAWGADVMTRLVAARDAKALELMKQAILKGITAAQQKLLETVDFEKKPQIATNLVVGNTAMIHLAAGIAEETLSVYPFRSPLEDRKLLSLDGNYRMAGPLQGYVGSDLLAVLEFLRLHDNSNSPALVMDLGTNSEIALWDGEQYWVTSCAAGPAFEGGGISCGAPALPGVATKIKRLGETWELLPVAEKEKSGLCGSALIALLAELVKSGELQSDGKLVNGNAVLLQEQPVLKLTQKDIRALQLAKGALIAGIHTITKRAGFRNRAIRSIIVTGAFARDLQAEDLKRIGIIPAAAQSVRFVNDGALWGAAQAMSCSDETFDTVRKRVTVINLAEEADFQEFFLEGLELKPME